MEEAKLPLKKVELSLTKFNEVAIPHHLDLLRQHKANILKYSAEGGAGRARGEAAAAARAASRLRALLSELSCLRARVRAEDRAAFDECTRTARDLTLAAITDYLGVIESGRRTLAASRAESTSAVAVRSARGGEGEGQGGEVAGSVTSCDSVGLVRLQVVDDEEAALREREEALRGWGELRGEVAALTDAWRTMHEAALAQRDVTAAVDTSVEAAADQVAGARGHLRAAEGLRAGAWAAGGAAAGALVAGPVGLAAGLKAGAAAALAGSLLGALAARLLAPRGGRLAPAPPSPPPRKND